METALPARLVPVGFRGVGIRDKLRAVPRAILDRWTVAVLASGLGCTAPPATHERAAAAPSEALEAESPRAAVQDEASTPGLGVAQNTAPRVRRQVIDNTEIRTLDPRPDGRAYQLYVGLPGSYAEHPDKRYPVLYLCDGYWDFALVNAFYGNLLYDKVIPEIILVGFGYQGDKPNYDRLRRWEYTPVADTHAQADAGESGHSADFLAAIEHEIIPFVEREYRVDASFRALGGSSLGGLFTLYAAFARPGLFQAYIAPSPAVVWAGDWLFGYEDAFAKSGQSLRGRLFMTGAGEEWPEFLNGIRRFDARLRRRAYPDLVYEFRLVEGERHAGTKAESYNRGVRFAFASLVAKAAAR